MLYALLQQIPGLAAADGGDDDVSPLLAAHQDLLEELVSYGCGGPSCCGVCTDDD